jgi:hypothetical protein
MGLAGQFSSFSVWENCGKRLQQLGTTKHKILWFEGPKKTFNPAQDFSQSKWTRKL